MLSALIGLSGFSVPALQNLLQPIFATEAALSSLGSFLLTIGGALIGAAAIVSSLVLFAMQVNVERMPHGLFRRLSADRRLLSAFAATFILAVVIASLSLYVDQQRVGAIAFIAFWGTAINLGLFLYGYRRALILVNPAQQLGMVVRQTQRELRAWARRAKRAAPLFSDRNQLPQTSPFPSQHDLTRTAYFQVNRGWTEGAQQGVRYAVSFSRRYAEQGDHEVSTVAMNAIIAINAAYIETKGKTFFANQLLLDNPLTTDGFINDTLEHLRQSARIGVTRGDEQQIEQTLRTIADLVRVYLAIDYASPHASKDSCASGGRVPYRGSRADCSAQHAGCPNGGRAIDGAMRRYAARNGWPSGHCDHSAEDRYYFLRWGCAGGLPARHFHRG